ncbi:hypothetical protein FRB94_006756 [Tulasnella sp. JGI-2019a]|nr:hypothetical protein FRB94_006756 [Tulasnella sp. JGI-2019a]
MTSRLFHDLTEPLLFTEIFLFVDRPGSEIGTRSRVLIHHLTTRAETRQWVKSVEITTAKDWSKSMDCIADIFVKLHNLRDIVFHGINLTDDMVRHMLHLSRPFRLKCWDTSCAAESRDLFSDTRNLQIAKLLIKGFRPPSMIPVIARLAFGSHLSVLELGQYEAPYIYLIFLQNPDHSFDSLRHLEVYEPVTQVDMTGFLSFLVSCPQLSHLGVVTVHTFMSEAKPTFLLPPTAISHLSSFDAPFYLAGLLAQGRPVISLRLRCRAESDLDRELLSQLANGSTPLRELNAINLIWRDDVLLDVVEYLPTLQSLKIQVVGKHGFNWMLDRLASGVQLLPSLQQFVVYNFTRPGICSADIDHVSLEPPLGPLKAANDFLEPIGFRLKTERCKGEMQWVFLPLSRLPVLH